MPLTADQALDLTQRLYAVLVGRRKEIKPLERYFRGEQPLAYATDEWSAQHQERFRGFADNWCGVVGRAPAERMGINGFRVGAPGDALSDDERWLWDQWNINEGPAQASQGFLTSTVAKRSAVLVWGDPDTDEPVMTWEHPSQVVFEYAADNPRRKVAMLKSWVDDERELATLYTPDEVWKWERRRISGEVVDGRTSSGLFVVANYAGGHRQGWEPRRFTGDDSFPLRNPLGRVPGTEYSNRPMLGGEPLSDIAGTMAMQDAVNLLWAYLFTAADFASMPARVVMGQAPPKMPILDQAGQVVGEQAVDIEELKRGRLLWLTGQNTKIGEWKAAALDVFTDVINVAVRHVAAQTSTPIYLVHGELGNVNGETLTGLDAPLVSKVRDSHDFYGPRVRETMELLALAGDRPALAAACRTGTVKWRNPETRLESQMSDAALKDRQRGLPMAYILERRDGLDQDEIDRVMSMVREEQIDPLAARVFGDVTGQGSDAPVG